MPADKDDVDRALQLAPDDADALLAAAQLAIEAKDLAIARDHLDRGLEKHPANPDFYRLSASMELAENHPDRAEAVLRRGIAAAPEAIDLKVLLTESLISQRKIDGADGAAEWIERLRGQRLRDGYHQFLLARLSIAQDRWDEAVERLESGADTPGGRRRPRLPSQPDARRVLQTPAERAG